MPTETAPTTEQTTPQTTEQAPAQAEPQARGTTPTTPALFDEKEQSNSTENTETQNQTQGQEQTPETPRTLTAEDITLQEGFEYDDELGKSFLDVLNDEKLSRKELAQKLADLYQTQQVKMLEGLKAADTEKVKKFEADLAAEKAEWLKQCQADKEYGGQNWDATQAIIDKGCKQLATPEAVKLMQSYNLNTHPEIVRMFYRAGKLASEDNSQINGGGASKHIDPAEAIFGAGLREYISKRKE